MSIITIGFTGTRLGMSSDQKSTIRSLLPTLVDNLCKLFAFEDVIVYALHGDCIGADEDFHNIAKSLGLVTIQRPSNIYSMRAYTDATAVASPASPLVRNEQIVLDSDIVVACPTTYEEVIRSGTWSTIRRARKHHKNVVVVLPDGSIKHEKPALGLGDVNVC